MACPKIVGLDVSPVTARSRTYRASAPVRSMTRLMLSSHRLWPSACSCCAGLGSASMRASETSAVAAPIRPVIHVDDSWAAQDLGRFSHALPGGAGAPPPGGPLVRWPVGDGGDLYLRAAEEDRADGGPDRPWIGEVA